MKALLTVLFVCSFTLSLAQNNVFYFKKSGRQVYQRDSADYTRVFLPPADGSPLFTVNEFYINGTPKMSGKASNYDPIKLEGTCTTFYDNGNKKEVLSYDKGILMGEQSFYYQNGKIRTVLEYLAEKSTVPANAIMGRLYLIKTCFDSTGTAMVANGNGYYKGLGLPSGSVYEEGNTKEGKREGTWKGSIKRMTFEERYENGSLLSGTLTDNNGETHNYTKYRETMPEFNGGMKKFYSFLNKTLHYPDKERSGKTQGRVVVSFVVEKDGSLTNFKIIRGVSPGLDEEAVRVVSLSPKWIPGMLFGEPVKVPYTVSIVFSL